MKNKTELYLKKVRDTMYQAQAKIGHRKIDEQLAAINVLIDELETVESKEHIRKIFGAGLLQVKKFQTQLIDFMLANLNELLEPVKDSGSPPQALSTGIPVKESQSLFSKLSEGFDDALQSITKFTDTFSLEGNFKDRAEAFTVHLKKAEALLRKSPEEQSIKAESFTKLINNYSLVVEKKYGAYSHAERLTQPIQVKRKSKPRDTVIEKPSNQDLINLRQKHRELSQLISQHRKGISASIKEHNERAPNLSNHVRSDRLIKDQLELINGIADRSLPALLKMKEDTIGATRFLLQAKYSNHKLKLSQEQLEKYRQLEEEYFQKYGRLTKEKLYEIIIEQDKEYIKQLSYLEPKLANANNLISHRTKEIEEQSQAKKIHSIESQQNPVVEIPTSTAHTGSSSDSDTNNIETLPESTGIVAYKSELNALKEQYQLYRKEISATIQGFKETKEKNGLVADEASIKSLIASDEQIRAKINQVRETKRAIIKELTSPDARLQPGLELEVSRVQEQKKCLTTAIEDLKNLKNSLTENLLTFIKEVDKATMVRSSTLNIRTFHIFNEIKELREYVAGIKQNNAYSEYVKIDEPELNELTKAVEEKAAKFPEQSGQTIERIYESTSYSLKQYKDSITSQVKKADYFIATTMSLQNRIQRLVEQRQKTVLNKIYNHDLFDLRATEHFLNRIHESYNSSSLFELKSELGTLEKRIDTIEKESNAAIQEHNKRNQYNTVRNLSDLISKINEEKAKFAANTVPYAVLQEMHDGFIKNKNDFLNLKTPDYRSFRNQCAATIFTQVTEEKLAKLTNEAPDATWVGNVFRFLAEIIHVIQDMFADKPRYRTQFFASSTELEVAKYASELHNCLNRVEEKIEPQEMNDLRIDSKGSVAL